MDLNNYNDLSAAKPAPFSSFFSAASAPALANHRTGDAGIAAQGAAQSESPLGNTGNTFNARLSELSRSIRQAAFLNRPKPVRPLRDKAAVDLDIIAKSRFEDAFKRDSIVKIDWLTVTFPAVESTEFYSAERRLTNLFDLVAEHLSDAGVVIVYREKGLYAYKNSAQLRLVGDGVDVACGNLAYDLDQGLMLELTGVGCSVMRHYFSEIYSLIHVYSGRITRIDFALDLDSRYCRSESITVPKLAYRHEQGAFRSIFTPSGRRVNSSVVGQWQELIFKGITPETYDPELHALGGLTYNCNPRSSENQLVFYEKGKQLLGCVSLADQQYISSVLAGANPQSTFSSDFNPDFVSEMNWIRIERRIRRGGNKKNINPLFLADPDSAFCQDFPDLSATYLHYFEWVGRQDAALSEYRSEKKKKDKALLLTRKISWARRQYGRLVATLKHEKMSTEDIVDILSRDSLIKDYVFDLID